MIVDINAIGSHVLPVLIFPRVHFKIDMLTGAFTISNGAVNPKGWSNFEVRCLRSEAFLSHLKCLARKTQIACFWIKMSPNFQSLPPL
jgi:hypothetical protein